MPVSPGDQPIVPVIQLTVQPPRPSVIRDNFLANALLRELQRQAVLIAARDELGLGTRDMVLREPFATHNINRVTTVLIETRVWRGDQAQICLARFDGHQPADPYALADLQVDQSQNTFQKWVGFKIGKDPIVDYPEFVARCEEASRTTYLDALKSELVLGNFTPRPVRWAQPGSAGLADSKALDRLRHMDVFSQYLALRLLHGQMAVDGASPDRLSAIVRAYANLGQLTTGQWSQANKVFFARSLLYAQRLVVHENASAESLYVRAYSRALAGLHSAALDDLDAAAKKSVDEPAPPWASMVKALCRFDAAAIEQAVALCPWQYKSLGTFLAADIAEDDFPQNVEQDALSRALNEHPGMFALAATSTDPADTNTPRPADRVVDQLPVLLSETLKDATLPMTVLYAARRVTPGDDSFRQVAMVRDRLCTASSRFPMETAEPSLGVLADLIEQQEMLGLVHKAVTIRNAGNQAVEYPKLLANAQAIISRHLWGPYVEALGIDSSNDARGFHRMLKKIKDHDPGAWVQSAVSDLNLNGGDAQKIAEGWQTAANLSADSLVDDYTDQTADAKSIDHNHERYLSLLRKTSPHSAMLAEAWMRSMPEDRVRRQKALYVQTLSDVEQEFCNRPGVMQAACDWCEDRGDFDRSLRLLQKIDQIEPSGSICDRIARNLHRQGHDFEAIAQLMRGVLLKTDTDEVDTTTLYQRAACYCINDGRYADALECIQFSDNAPTPRVWQLMVRCYEAMGNLEAADQCLHQQETTDPQSLVPYYLWAKRLDRNEAVAIGQKARAAVMQADDSYPLSEFYLDMADDHERKAMDELWKKNDTLSDALDIAQALVMAKKLSEKQRTTRSLALINRDGVSNQEFGSAMKSLASAKMVEVGITGFDRWVKRQLDDEDAMDWYSLAGRYLLAAGHPDLGKSYLIKAIRLSPHERVNYFLAWRELQQMGENPKLLISAATTQP